jgi:hypothetical protein
MTRKENKWESQFGWGGGSRINTVLANTETEFYISYNDRDIADYGCATTALVQGQMEHFYILNGDHRENYTDLVEQGFDKCMEYFIANISQINKKSEKPNMKWIENSSGGYTK